MVGAGFRLMMWQGSCERASGKERASMQEGREGSGVGGMGQKIFGRRDLERVQYCGVEMETKAYNMMRNEDFSINESAQLCALIVKQLPYQYTAPTYNATTAAQTLILRYGFLCFLIVLWRYCREQCRTSTTRFTCHCPRPR